MKCEKCGIENKDNVRFCKKCGYEFKVEQLWMPDWRWHMKTLGIIYAVVIVGYVLVSFLLHRLEPPYNLRQISPEMTPWLNQKK